MAVEPVIHEGEPLLVLTGGAEPVPARAEDPCDCCEPTCPCAVCDPERLPFALGVTISGAATLPSGYYIRGDYTTAGPILRTGDIPLFDFNGEYEVPCIVGCQYKETFLIGEYSKGLHRNEIYMTIAVDLAHLLGRVVGISFDNVRIDGSGNPTSGKQQIIQFPSGRQLYTRNPAWPEFTVFGQTAVVDCNTSPVGDAPVYTGHDTYDFATGSTWTKTPGESCREDLFDPWPDPTHHPDLKMVSVWVQGSTTIAGTPDMMTSQTRYLSECFGGAFGFLQRGPLADVASFVASVADINVWAADITNLSVSIASS